MDNELCDAISFEDAIAISQQRHREITEKLRHLHRELRDRDVVIKRLQAKLGKQCAAELENCKLQQELRELKGGLARLLQQDPHLKDKLTAMTAANSNDAGATNGDIPVVPMDAIQALALNKKNYIARLPFEMQGDIFMNLDRFSLDRAGFACPQFRAVVGYLAGGSLRVLGPVYFQVSKSTRANLDADSCRATPSSKPKRCSRRQKGHAGTSLAEEDAYDFRVSVEYSSDPLALKNGSTDENVSRGWSFSNTDAATARFIGLLRHACVTSVTLTGPLPIGLLQAFSSADLDVTIRSLDICEFLRRLTPGSDVPLDILTNDFLVTLKDVGAVEFVFRSKAFKVRAEGDGGWGAPPHVGRRALVNTYDGGYPDLDAGLTAFLFRGSEAQDEPVEVKFPAARVPPEFCQRLLKAAMSDGRSVLRGRRGDLVVKLDEFEEYARDLDQNTLVYKVPQSPTSDMLLELKIIALENAPNDWRLVEFRRCKKPAQSTHGWGGGGGGWGGGGGGWGGGGWGGGGGGWGGGGWGGGGGGWGRADDNDEW